MLFLVAILAIAQLWAAFKKKDVLDSACHSAPPSVPLHDSVQCVRLAGVLAIMAFETCDALVIQ